MTAFNPDYGDNSSVTNLSEAPSDADQWGVFPPLVVQSSQRIAQLVRMHLQDFSQTFSARLMCNGAQWRFELPVEKIEPQSIQVVTTDGTGNNTTNFVAGTDFTADYRQGIISLNTTPAAGLLLAVTGTYYKDFNAQEIDVYVRQAFLMHTGTKSANNVPVLDSWPEPTPPTYAPGVYGTPPPNTLAEVEEYPLSLLATTLALWDLAISGAQDIDIRTPDGVFISRAQRFSQITSMIAQLEAQYKSLCSVLDIGLYAITVGDLRRVSMTTNRLVPLFVAQELTDRSWAQLEKPPIPSYDVVVTNKGLWISGTAYNANDVVAEGGQTYKAIQAVPASGPSPTTDVNPDGPYPRRGFYWEYTNDFSLSTQWWGAW